MKERIITCSICGSKCKVVGHTTLHYEPVDSLEAKLEELEGMGYGYSFQSDQPSLTVFDKETLGEKYCEIYKDNVADAITKAIEAIGKEG